MRQETVWEDYCWQRSPYYLSVIDAQSIVGVQQIVAELVARLVSDADGYLLKVVIFAAVRMHSTGYTWWLLQLMIAGAIMTTYFNYCSNF